MQGAQAQDTFSVERDQMIMTGTLRNAERDTSAT